MDKIKIRVNHSELEFPIGGTLSQLLLQQVGDRQKGIAVAVNQRVIPKAEQDKHALKANDQILIITATQGG